MDPLERELRRDPVVDLWRAMQTLKDETARVVLADVTATAPLEISYDGLAPETAVAAGIALKVGDRVVVLRSGNAPGHVIAPLNQRLWLPPTLASGWSNYGSGYRPVGYRMVPDKTIKLRGLLRATTAKASGSLLLTLPSDYRPVANEEIGASASRSGTGVIPVLVDVLSDGQVIGYWSAGNFASGDYISLNTIEFTID